MPEGPQHLITAYDQELDRKRERWAHRVDRLIGRLDAALEGLGSGHWFDGVQAEAVGGRVRLTFAPQVEPDFFRQWNEDPFPAEEVRRRYHAVGFADVSIDFSTGEVTFTAYDDSKETEQERMLRLLSEALRDAGSSEGPAEI